MCVCVYNLRCLSINNEMLFRFVAVSTKLACVVFVCLGDFCFSHVANFMTNAWAHTHLHTQPHKVRLAYQTEANLLYTHAPHPFYKWHTNLICRFSGISSFVADYNLPETQPIPLTGSLSTLTHA